MRAFFARLGGGGPASRSGSKESSQVDKDTTSTTASLKALPRIPPPLGPDSPSVKQPPARLTTPESDGSPVHSPPTHSAPLPPPPLAPSAAPATLSNGRPKPIPGTASKGRSGSVGQRPAHPVASEPVKGVASTAARRNLSSTAEGKKTEKMVAFTTPTTPEPVLALTGEPVNPKLSMSAGVGVAPKPAKPPARNGRSSTTPKTTTTTTAASTTSKPSLDGSASSRPSTSRPADSGAILKAPLQSAVRVKKGSASTLPGASTSSFQTTSRSSSSTGAKPAPSAAANSRSLSGATSQASRVRRPDLARPLSAMSDSSAFSGSTALTDGRHANDGFLGSHGNWSQWADEDLLMNLGPRERTRQEVLWEIVSSEERYVVDLQNLVNTFINSLLPPPPVGSPTLDQWTPPLDTFTSSSTTTWGSPVSDPLVSPRNVSAESADLLPIAARFQSSAFMNRQTSDSSAGSSSAGLPVHAAGPAFGTNEFDSFNIAHSKPFLYDTLHRPHPLGQTRPVHIPFPDPPNRPGPPNRAHQSMPPPARTTAPALAQPQLRQASADLARRKLSNAPPPPPAPPAGPTVDAHAQVFGLPDELKEIMEVLRDGILPGHLALSQALKARHEEQFPLVRSLADIFNQHSYVLREYTTYVLHLSDALGIVDSALTSTAGSGRKAAKSDEGHEVARLRRIFQELDELASDKGESGLAISLSKPFQRLLKYPLLLQNLLYHTDPSTKEYEATLAMVDDVEVIIRSIEDEKTAVEERVKTRDVFARIDGLEREKMLMIPKPSRLLQEEYPCLPDGSRLPPGSVPRPAVPVKQVKEKKNLRRLSDMLKSSSNAKPDLWVVRFTDVSLLCQRTGTTTLPLAATATRSSSLPDLHGKTKFATIGGRRAPQRPRNLYRFVRVQEWTMSQSPTRHGMVSMEDISRNRSRTGDADAIEEEPLHEDEEPESDDSFDAKSRMSFSYWGGDKVEPVPLPDGRSTSASNRRGGPSALSQASKTIPPVPNIVRRSSAQEKFGSRLRSPEPSTTDAPRPASRVRPTGASVTTKRAATPAARPAWNSNGANAPVKPRTLSASQAHPAQRSRKSPTPSQDIAASYMAQTTKDT